MPTNLTGRKRFRVESGGFFKKPLVVLQVEERNYGTYHDLCDPYDILGMDYDNIYFRDAVIEDLTEVPNEDTLS